MSELTFENSAIDQNLLSSGKRPTKPEVAAPTPAPAPQRFVSLQTLLSMAFYVVLAIVSFLVFLLPKLPYDVITQDAMNFLSQQTPFIWKSDSVKTSFILGPKIEFKKLSLITKPFGLGSGGEPKTIQFDSLSLSPSVFASLPIPGLKKLSPAGSFTLAAFQGTASGSATMAGNDVDAAIQGEKFNLEKIAPLLPIPDLDMKGLIQQLVLDLHFTQNKLAKSNGAVKFKLKNLQLDPAGLNLGMPLPILSIGDVNVQGTLKNGHLVLEHTQLGDATHDAELYVDGTIILKDPMEFSDVDLTMRLRFAPKITQAIPLIDSFFGAGKRPDGYYGLKLTGSIANLSMPQPYLGN